MLTITPPTPRHPAARPLDVPMVHWYAWLGDAPIFPSSWRDDRHQALATDATGFGQPIGLAAVAADF